MRNKRKVILTVLCLLVLIVFSAVGTVAYLTDVQEVKNTFTVGQVKIELDEAVTDVNGKPLDVEGKVTTRVLAERTKTGNEYHLIPGSSYTKDPTVTVLAGSESSYIRVLVTFHGAEQLQAMAGKLPDQLDQLLIGWDSTKWVLEGTAADTKENTLTVELRYCKAADGFNDAKEKADEILPPVFTGLSITGNATNAQLDALREAGFKTTVTAHAIQTGNFADADEAWAAFDTPAAP